MSVNLESPKDILPIDGVRWTSAAAGIKKPGQTDLAVMTLDAGAAVAGVFTQNAFAAAPVQLAKKHLQAQPQALLINSGNANAGTGTTGDENAYASCAALAEKLGISAEQVLPFSTGVIGEQLPMPAIKKALADLPAGRANGWLDAAQAIMTTDTVPKASSRRVSITDAAGQQADITLSGIAKGSGMIRPNMATMLSFVATDAQINQADLQLALQEAVNLSFNSITVDGDTSTNDSCILAATGKATSLSPADSTTWAQFQDALNSLLQELAQAIVRDAEGATRFITLAITGAKTIEEARTVGYTVGHSPLVKTACFAGDPNWGRILAAVGRAPIKALDVGKVAISLDDVALIRDGQPDASYQEAAGAEVMGKSEYTIKIDLGRGQAQATLWTSDLSYEYVRINAEYRS